jgi:hypothetical protein
MSPGMRVSFRRTLAAIALAAPLAGSGCITGTCPDIRPPEEMILDMPDAELTALVAKCKMEGDCDPLCNEVFEREHGAPPPSRLQTCYVTVDGESSLDMVVYGPDGECIGGRRPAGYRRGRPCGPAVGAYIAQQAELEAASVRAFADLHDDLIALGAPRSLVRAAVSAAADEVRHARVCDRLARRHGVVPDLRAIGAAARRTRAQLATDNLVEGCVRETYGAVLASYQARAAGDPELRGAMSAIARDEAKHAALSWRIHGWLWPRLSADERRAALAAAVRARGELADRAGEPDAELRELAGLPDPVAGRAVLAALDDVVWRTRLAAA